MKNFRKLFFLFILFTFVNGFLLAGALAEGFQNTQETLGSGVSAKGVGISAGMAIGVELIRQMANGEQINFDKAIKVVANASFAGGAVGSALGATAGAAVAPFLNRIPFAGAILAAIAPVVGGIVGYSAGSTLAGETANGASMTVALKDALSKIDWVSVAGQSVGSTIGAFMGSFLGPVGMVAGGMVGGYLGDLAAKFISSKFSSTPTTKVQVQQKIDPDVLNDPAMTASLSNLLDSGSDPVEPTPMKVKIKVNSDGGAFGN
ncbi:MAG: hypothetical protein HQM08_27165 [Candidatus Riflebacteria bacterium]|nr:hypothetical protein [Candidatus Riflebacteria bacterium]